MGRVEFQDIEEVSGIGPKRAAALRQAGFGDVEALAAATRQQLRAVGKISDALADSIKEQVGTIDRSPDAAPTRSSGIHVDLVDDRVFDRVGAAYDALADRDVRLPDWDRDGFLDALHEQVLGYESAAGFIPAVVRGEPGAEAAFRDRLGAVAPSDPGLVGYTPLPEPGGGDLPCEFAGGRVVGGLYFAARLVATSEDDWQRLEAQVTALYETSEWVESLHAAADHYERTGESHPLSVRARLFERAVGAAGWPGRPSGPAPLEPWTPGDPPGGGRGPPGGFGGERPPIDVCGIQRRGCVHDLAEQAARGGRRAADARPSRPAVWADTITSVSDAACSGDDLVVRGSGFGDRQPDNVTLLLPTATGCRPATVPAGGWTDTEIRLSIPSWMRAGCLGFRDEDIAAAWGEYYRQVGESLEGLAATSVRCRLLGANTPLLGPTEIGYSPGCPPCTGRNRFDGTVPEIRRFRIDGRDAVTVGHDATVVLSWDVSNADAVAVTRRSGSGPRPNVSPSGGPDFTGSRSLSLAATRDGETVYRLEATNDCGSVEREVTLRVRRLPNVSVAGIEVTQSIQTLDFADPSASNTVFLVEGKRTMVRAYVDSGLPASYNDGGRLPLVATLETVPLSGQQASFTPALSPLPAAESGREALAAPTRLQLTDSVNFEPPRDRTAERVRFRVTVEPDDDHARWRRASAEVTVEFVPSPTLDLVPIRVFDDRRVDRAATDAEVGNALRDMRAMFPLAGDRLDLWSTGGADVIRTNRDYNTDDAWDDLLDDLEELAEEFDDNGEIWCAAVPAGARSQPGRVGLAIQGDWWWYSKASWDSGVLATPAHEVGHAVGFDHVSSRTGVVGVHVADRTVKDARRPQLMAQAATFGDTDRWPGLGFQLLFYRARTGVFP